jgi:hypothetical protein
MKLAALRLTFAALLAAASPAVFAQEPAAPPADAAATATANPELVGMLVKDLAVTPTQAEGGAGAVFSLAKKKLKPEDYAKVAAAVPGIDGLLKAAPVPDPKAAALDLVAPGAGVASLASSLGKLGLKPEMAMKLVPAISGYLKGKGAGDAGALVGGLLK